MTTLTGMKNAQYLSMFLGHKVAIKIGEEFHIFPNLSAIFAGGVIQVTDSQGDVYSFDWKDFENPYVVMNVDNSRIILR